MKETVKSVWNKAVVASRWILVTAGSLAIVYEAFQLGGPFHALAVLTVLGTIAEAAYTKGETLKFS